MAKEFVTVYEFCVNVSTDKGVRFQTRKYRCTKTEQNYLPQQWTDEDEKNGFRPHHGRIKVNEINVIADRGVNIGKLVTRHIYYLESQQEEAEAKLKQAITDELNGMKINADKLWSFWAMQL